MKTLAELVPDWLVVFGVLSFISSLTIAGLVSNQGLVIRVLAILLSIVVNFIIYIGVRIAFRKDEDEDESTR